MPNKENGTYSKSALLGLKNREKVLKGSATPKPLKTLISFSQTSTKNMKEIALADIAERAGEPKKA
ncbi:MAG: hypothetical protein Q4D20_09870 [Clostridia bacterium]|nr:hypothetical protein [Clostridia bacterium]